MRDSHVDGDVRTIVTTDRLSAFDRLLGTIPFKGQVLNEIANYWFDATSDIEGYSGTGSVIGSLPRLAR